MKEYGGHTVGTWGLGWVELLESSCNFFTGECFSEFDIYFLNYTGGNGIGDLLDSTTVGRCADFLG